MSDRPPVVSVVIPTHNRAHFVERAVESVLNQTYSDYEMIVVDDCSSDATPKKFSQTTDPRVRYIRHTRRQGGSAARNTGIAAAKGKFIAFLDDDDEWLPEKLDLQVKLLGKNPTIAMVYSGFFTVNNANKKVLNVVRPNKCGHLYDSLLQLNCIGTTSTAMIRRECFTRVGTFDTSLPSFQDWDLWLRIARKYEIGCVEEPLVRFFDHDVRITHDFDARIEGKKKVRRKILRDIENKPRISSYHHFKIGRFYCQKGDVPNGRKELFKAIKLHPYCFLYYKYLVPCLFGPSFYNALLTTKRSVVKCFRLGK